MSGGGRVEALQPITAAALDAALGFVGSDAWMGFVERIYGYRPHRLEATDGKGKLALCHVRHPLFGNYLATAPYASYGGFAFASNAARDEVLEQAHALGRELGTQYVNIRFDAGGMPPPGGWVQQPIYATYRLSLSAEPEGMLASYSSDHRNHVRKSLKRGFSIRFGRMDLLDEAYEALARSMHELGSPYHAKSYLRAMLEALGQKLELAVLYGPQRQLAGAGVFITHGDVATNLHANILRRFRGDYAGEFLYWSAITRYGSRGLHTFDLGRSLIGSGNEKFKVKWKPHKQVLAYWYALNGTTRVPELNQKSAKFQAAIWTWKRLPSFVVRPAGPFLIKGLA